MAAERRIASLKKNLHLLILAILFLAGIGIRLYQSNIPPLNFHATRQYRSLLIARGYFFARSTSIPEWEKEVANINLERQGLLEPPVMEWMVSSIYRIFGSEQYWISHLISTIFWCIGAGMLYLISRKFVDENAALFAITFYLFLPFAVAASRSFQPDPLMVMLLLGSLYAILEYYERQSIGRFVVVILLSALAIFIKPISIFVIYIVFIFLAFYKRGIKRSLTDLRLFAFVVLALLPTAAYYLYGIVITGTLREQARSSFLPQLLVDPFFWKGWLNNIYLVVGFPIFILGLLGIMLFRKGLPRLFILSMWIGYVLFCLVFDYHIATHDYYHLQLIPILALSLAPVAGLIYDRIKEFNPNWYWRAGLWMIVLFALALSINTARNQITDSTYQKTVNIAEQIGAQVHHSINTVFLASDYGLSLEYHGELSGEPWPLSSDMEWEKLAGITVMNAEQRFNYLFAGNLPEYFIIVDRTEFDKQIDLEEYLTSTFRVISTSKDFIIFDLKETNLQ